MAFIYQLSHEKGYPKAYAEREDSECSSHAR